MEKLDNHINKYKEIKAPHTGIGFGVIASSGAGDSFIVATGGTITTDGDCRM